MSSGTAASGISASCGQKWAPQGSWPWVAAGVHAAFPAASSILWLKLLGREKSKHAESANFKSGVCKMKQLKVISKLLSMAQASWSILGDRQGCKETPGKGPWLCILFQPIPPQIKLVLPAHLPVQNYNFYVPNLRAALACPSPVFEVCWLLGLWS